MLTTPKSHFALEYSSIIICFFRYADQVSIGNEALVEGNDELTPAKVINVNSSSMEGDHCS